MKLKIILLAMFTILLTSVRAQTAADSIKATVNNLFKAMKECDTVLLKNCFAADAILQSVVKTKTGEVQVRNTPISEFTAFLAKEEKGAADEQIVYGALENDGMLATVWTPYKFYYKGKFSHCGINSFQLVKLGGQWKIQYLIDTRRRTGCD